MFERDYLSSFVVHHLGMASFAQERIFLDEKVRFSDKIAIYNELTVLRIGQGRLSIDRLQDAFRFVLAKHKILRTSLVFDDDNGTLRQSITDSHQTFELGVGQTFADEDELRRIVHQTTIDPRLFDLSAGRVFHCEIVRQRQSMINAEKKTVNESDVLVIGFHHAANDRTSRQVFYADLCMAYNKEMKMTMDEQRFQYIDYSIHERLVDMTSSREFWRSELEGYNLEGALLLPVDRHRSSVDQRSGLASIAQISFSDEATEGFLKYASIHEVTPFQLGLATFYAFVFKLTHGHDDLCIACLNANRYRSEVQNMIGMFVATVPYRAQVNPGLPFETLVQYVREKSLSILEHSHYPLQYILADTDFKQFSAEFLETGFDFITITSNIKQLSFDGSTLERVSLSQSVEVTKFDFKLVFVYDMTSNDNTLAFHLVCSQDMFDKTSIETMTQRFQHLFSQIFSSKFDTLQVDDSPKPIGNLSLILPEEMEEMKGAVIDRLPFIVDIGMFAIMLLLTN